jgi:glutathione S-transferase
MERAELPHLARWYDNLSQRAAFKNHIMIGLT